ncbi:MAG: hypothetical protein U5N58_14085 [Actinomycetota bacterium]|nr:hypothetical protein [Actinomycetota bacterium]
MLKIQKALPLAITSTWDRAQELVTEVASLSKKQVLSYPSPPMSIYYRDKGVDMQKIASRLKVIKAAGRKQSFVVVASINSCLNLMDRQLLDKL